MVKARCSHPQATQCVAFRVIGAKIRLVAFQLVQATRPTAVAVDDHDVALATD